MYTQAAQTLRAPYWDWAASPTVPAATVPQSLEVNIPNGNSLQQVEVDNPLATYKFPQSALAGDFGTFDSQNRAQIYRCPAPQSYPDSANQLLSQRNLKQWVVSYVVHLAIWRHPDHGDSTTRSLIQQRFSNSPLQQAMGSVLSKSIMLSTGTEPAAVS